MSETATTDAAPDFRQARRYPSRGAVVGPMWQAMWDEMSDGAEHNGRDMIDAAAARFGASPKTAENLLNGAVRAGRLVRRAGVADPVRKRKVTYYRRLTWADVVPEPVLAPVEAS